MYVEIFNKHSGDFFVKPEARSSNEHAQYFEDWVISMANFFLRKIHEYARKTVLSFVTGGVS